MGLSLLKHVNWWNIGKMKYREALKIQEKLVSIIKTEVESGQPTASNTVIIVEHPAVYTTGIRTKDYTSQEETHLQSLGADFVRTNRGGLITFHGPGQLVAYPVLNLRDFVPPKAARKAALGVKWYVNSLEETVINVCRGLGLEAQRSPHTGVWLGDNKVCAMGVHSSNLVTSHGLAINCDMDMSWFNNIVPCGIQDKGVTSLSLELDRPVGLDQVEELLRLEMKNTFGCNFVNVDDEFKKTVLEDSFETTKSDQHSRLDASQQRS